MSMPKELGGYLSSEVSHRFYRLPRMTDGEKTETAQGLECRRVSNQHGSKLSWFRMQNGIF